MFDNPKIKIILFTLVLFLTGAAGFFLSEFLNKDKDIYSSQNQGQSQIETLNQFSARLSQRAKEKAVVLGEEYYKFIHPDYGFSLEYPKELEIRGYQEDEESQTIVFQKKGGRGGFQIFVTPFEEEGALTKERIIQDLPSALIDEVQEVVLGDGTRALIFWSEDSFIGRTREVWFLSGNYLYEITTYADLDVWLAEVLKTWKTNDQTKT